MPRPKKMKIVHGDPIPLNRVVYKPQAIPMTKLEVNSLSMVEFEAIRLIDNDGKSQIEAAEMMDISQPTISRILKSGRNKIADAFVNGKAIRIEGGEYKLMWAGYGCKKCKGEWELQENYQPEKCPNCQSEEIFAMKKTT